ncbi:superoxide dismutase, partial [Candidatus Saccharibacteria bacterium]|nr:superoxide dismutase [Candidatus Saccharibacteria bacterium]
MFKLPDLDYRYDALGKYISKDIMELHHSKHHQIYVDKLNAVIDNSPELNGKNLVDILANLESVPESSRNAIRNFGGGHYNHTLFWLFMSPNGGNQPTGKLADDIKSQFGSFQEFIDKFEAEALAVFGSGWVWL